MPYSRLSFNCEILDARSIDLSDRLWSTGFAAGFGVYETLRVDDGVLRYAADHGQRLLQSADLINLEHGWSQQQVVQAAEDLCAALVSVDAVREFNVRILLLGSSSVQGAELWMHAQPRHTPAPEQYEHGVTAMLARVGRYLPLAKSMGQLAAFQAWRQARAAGHYEALLLDDHGLICEGSRSNLIGVRGSTVIVAPREAVLPGVTQARVERAAQAAGLAVDCSGLTVPELARLDAAALCGTSLGILPLSAVDDMALPTGGSAMRALQASYARLS